MDRLRDGRVRVAMMGGGVRPVTERPLRLTQLEYGVAQNLVGFRLGHVAAAQTDVGFVATAQANIETRR